MLQWSRRHSSAEMSEGDTFPLGIFLLQWSRRHSSAEMLNDEAYSNRYTTLQWSRRHSSAEIVCLFSVVFPKGSVPIFECLGFLLPVQSKKHDQLIPGDFITYCYFNSFGSFERSWSSCNHPTTRNRPNRKRVIILVTILLRNLSNNHGFTFEGFVFSP